MLKDDEAVSAADGDGRFVNLDYSLIAREFFKFASAKSTNEANREIVFDLFDEFKAAAIAKDPECDVSLMMPVDKTAASQAQKSSSGSAGDGFESSSTSSSDDDLNSSSASSEGGEGGVVSATKNAISARANDNLFGFDEEEEEEEEDEHAGLRALVDKLLGKIEMGKSSTNPCVSLEGISLSGLDWEHPFDATVTEVGSSFGEDALPCSFMMRSAEDMRYLDCGQGLEVVQLLIGRRRYVTLILPPVGQLEATLDICPSLIESWMESITSAHVRLRLPRFDCRDAKGRGIFACEGSLGGYGAGHSGGGPVLPVTMDRPFIVCISRAFHFSCDTFLHGGLLDNTAK